MNILQSDLGWQFGPVTVYWQPSIRLWVNQPKLGRDQLDWLATARNISVFPNRHLHPKLRWTLTEFKVLGESFLLAIGYMVLYMHLLWTSPRFLVHYKKREKKQLSIHPVNKYLYLGNQSNSLAKCADFLHHHPNPSSRPRNLRARKVSRFSCPLRIRIACSPCWPFKYWNPWPMAWFKGNFHRYAGMPFITKNVI